MNIIVVGCGRIGSGLAQLLFLRKHQVVMVDKETTAFESLGKTFSGRAITGIGFDREVLLQAGIEHTDSLAAVTGSDEANIVIARLSRLKFKVPQVVARVNDPRKAEIYRRFDIQTISPLSLSMNHFVDLLTYTNFAEGTSLGTGEVEIISIKASPLHSRLAVDVFVIPGEAHLIAITRQGNTFLPMQGDEIQSGDVLHLVVNRSSTDRLKAMFG